MKPLYWRSMISKDDCRSRLTHHHRGRWNEMNEMSMEKWWDEIRDRVKREKRWEKPTQTSFRPPWNQHEVIETRTRVSSDGRQAYNRLRHGGLSYLPIPFSNYHEVKSLTLFSWRDAYICWMILEHRIIHVKKSRTVLHINRNLMKFKQGIATRRVGF